MKNKRKKIRLSIYDVDAEITINIQETGLYRKAASYVTNRYAAYYDRYRESKSEIEIGLMTLLDIVVAKKIFKQEYKEDKDESKMKISLDILDHSLNVTIDPTDEDIWRSAANDVAARFNAYKVYYKEKNEHELILMTLLDLQLSSARLQMKRERSDEFWEVFCGKREKKTMKAIDEVAFSSDFRNGYIDLIETDLEKWDDVAYDRIMSIANNCALVNRLNESNGIFITGCLYNEVKVSNAIMIRFLKKVSELFDGLDPIGYDLVAMSHTINNCIVINFVECPPSLDAKTYKRGEFVEYGGQLYPCTFGYKQYLKQRDGKWRNFEPKDIKTKDGQIIIGNHVYDVDDSLKMKYESKREFDNFVKSPWIFLQEKNDSIVSVIANEWVIESDLHDQLDILIDNPYDVEYNIVVLQDDYRQCRNFLMRVNSIIANEYVKLFEERCAQIDWPLPD